jgi:phosphatidylglycerol---prolipoprotein diacylglyceryl transferase
MYPNLSYLLNDLFNTPVDNWTAVFQMSGLSIVISFVICTLLLKQEIYYREIRGLIEPIKKTNLDINIENTLMFIFCCISGYKIFYIIFNPSLFVQNPRDVILSFRGSYAGMAVLALLSLVALRNSGKRHEIIYFRELIWTIYITIAIFSLIGIKIFGIFEVDFSNKNFQEAFNSSGTNFYGGLTGGVLACYILCLFYKVNLGHLLNALAPVLMIGYSTGRLGCHISGDGCWGIINNFPKPYWFIFPDWLWSYNYPQNVINEGQTIPNLFCKHSMVLNSNVFPTSLYESLFSFLMFFILKSFREKMLRPYHLFVFFLFSMGVQRFFIEFIRVNHKYTFLGLYLSQAQFFSLCLIVISILFMCHEYKKIGNQNTSTKCKVFNKL